MPGMKGGEAAAGVRKAKIIRLESGEFRAPAKGRVFVRVPGDTTADVDFVDPALAALPAVREALGQLGIVVMDRSGELRRLLAEAKTPSALKYPADRLAQHLERPARHPQSRLRFRSCAKTSART